MSRIYLIGEINWENYAKFTKTLSEHELKGKNVIIELESEGGDPKASLAFYSRIKNAGVRITIEVRGFCASAAVLVLAAGHKKNMAKEAWVMVHEETDKQHGFVHDLEREIAHSRDMEDQCCRIMAEHTGVSSEEWAVMQEVTTYMTAKDCLKAGLIDEII